MRLFLMIALLVSGLAMAQAEAPVAASCSSCVLLTGDQSITGAKTFSGTVSAPLLISTAASGGHAVEITTNSKICLNGATCTVYLYFSGGGVNLITPFGTTFSINTATGAASWFATMDGTALSMSGDVSVGTAGSGDLNLYRNLYIGTTTPRLVFSGVAPTTPVACTSPTITHGKTVSFQADVGTSCTGVSTFTFTVPATTNGTRCDGDNITASTTRVLRQTAGWTGTTVTMTNFAIITDVPADFADGTDLVINCTGR